MRTSGAGRGGLLVAVAGAVAIGVAGCSTGNGTDTAKGDKTDSVEHAAAGSSTTSGTSATSSSSPSSLPSIPTPTSAATSSSTPSPSGTSTSSSSAPSTSAGSTTTKPKPSTPSSSKPPAPSTKPTGGSGWLAGVPLGHNTPGQLDPRCMTGRVVCIDMSTSTLLWMVDGKPQYGMDVRFGDENNPTRKGTWHIDLKMKDCISTIYHTPMPDAMFFSGGEAVHFSADFAKYGYAHHSHGCVNVRDRAAVERLFADTRLGDTVVVY